MTVNFRTSVPTYNYQRANQQKQKPAFGMAVAIPRKEYAGEGRSDKFDSDLSEKPDYNGWCQGY